MEAKEPVIVQGKIYPVTPILPSIQDTAQARRKVAFYPYKGMMATTERMFDPRSYGGKMKRYTSGYSLRKGSKADNIRKLTRIPVQERSNKAAYPSNIIPVMQQPSAFPELSGFDEVPAGTNTQSTVPNTTRGFWGNLNSVLSTVSDFYLQQQRMKADVRVAEARAVTYGPTMTGGTPGTAPVGGGSRIVSGIGNYLPYILAGGAGIIAIAMMAKKRK